MYKILYGHIFSILGAIAQKAFLRKHTLIKVIHIQWFQGLFSRVPSQMDIGKININASLVYLVLFFVFKFGNAWYSEYLFFFLGKITERSLITQTRKT